MARTRDERACRCNSSDAVSSDAVRFCAMGALMRVAMRLICCYDEAHCLAMLAASGRSNVVLPQINDVEGHAAIVAMFKRALA